MPRRAVPATLALARALPCLALAAACQDRAPALATDARPLVAVSIAPLAYLVEQLAGDRVELSVLLPPGASPHAFEPGLAHAQSLARARLTLRVGHPHLPFERAVFERLQVAGAGVIAVRCVDGDDGVHAHGDDHHQAAGDPHLWLDPAAMRACARRLLPALRTLLPDAGPELAAAAKRLEQDLDALEAELQRSLQGLPRQRYYVYHPAWSHLTRRHGLIEVAIEHEGKEPDPRSLARVMEQARADGVRHIFVQPQFPRRSVELVAETLGARVVVLDPMARDWAANLRQVAAALRQELSP